MAPHVTPELYAPLQVALVLAELAAHRAATHELYEILRERDFFQQVQQTQ